MFVFQISALTGMETAGSDAAGGDGGVVRVVYLAKKHLCSTEVFLTRNVKGGLFLDACHDLNSFGKLGFKIQKGDSVIVFKKYMPVIEFFSMRSKDRKKVLGQHGLWGCDNVNFKLHENGDLTLFSYTQFCSDKFTMIELTKKEQREITKCIWTISRTKLPMFENIEMMTREAINDILAECRMESQGYCRACKERGPHTYNHTCDTMTAKRLDRVLKGALCTYDKWPYSFGIRQLFEMLAPHVDYFKKCFRESMVSNKKMNDDFKVDALPAYVCFD